jgi:hypothetical protein
MNSAKSTFIGPNTLRTFRKEECSIINALTGRKGSHSGGKTSSLSKTRSKSPYAVKDNIRKQ